jgi:hypothetical protein
MIWQPWRYNRALIRNSSGVQVRDVVLVLREYDGEWSLQRRAATLNPGESITIRHGKNDLKAHLQYVIRGREHEHTEKYIDLWTGEGWVFDIQPDGTVVSGYDSPRND